MLGYSYIKYIGSEITKHRYVLINTLEPFRVVIPDFTFPNVTKGQYGESGARLLLEFYRIGTGSNYLILNFSIHAFEDRRSKLYWS